MRYIARCRVVAEPVCVCRVCVPPNQLLLPLQMCVCFSPPPQLCVSSIIPSATTPVPALPYTSLLQNPSLVSPHMKQACLRVYTLCSLLHRATFSTPPCSSVDPVPVVHPVREPVHHDLTVTSVHYICLRCSQA